MLASDVDDDVAVAVEAAGRVVIDVALMPDLAVPRLPDQRRIRGIDADALDGAVHAQADRAPRHRVAQPDHKRVVRLRHGAEGRELSSPGAAPLCDRRRSFAPAGCVAIEASEHGTMSRSSTVEKTIALSVSVRIVAALVFDGNALRRLGGRSEPEGQ